MSGVSKLVAALFVSATLVVAILFWLGSGYGQVSSDAYSVAQALYGCCLAKSDSRLELVESLLDGGEDQQMLEISTKERRWLEAMVAQAKDGEWQSAAKAARQMMEDQVQY